MKLLFRKYSFLCVTIPALLFFGSCIPAPPKPSSEPAVIRPEQRYEAVREAFASGRFPDALRMIEEIRSEYPADELDRALETILRAWWDRIGEDFKQGKTARAEKQVSLLRSRFRSSPIDLSLAMIRFYAGNLDGALEILEASDFSGSPFLTERAAALTGFIHYHKGRKEQAETVWRSAVDDELADLGRCVIDFEKRGKTWVESYPELRPLYEGFPDIVKKGPFGQTVTLLEEGLPFKIEVEDLGTYSVEDSSQKKPAVFGREVNRKLRLINRNTVRDMNRIGIWYEYGHNPRSVRQVRQAKPDRQERSTESNESDGSGPRPKPGPEQSDSIRWSAERR